MTILGKLKDSNNAKEENNKYVLPTVVRNTDEQLPLGKSVVISTLLHPATALLLWLVITIMALMGFHIDLLKKPEMPAKDIEFVLVNNPEQKPINKNTKNRADRNTRAGGKHNPKQPQAEPSPPPGPPKSSKPKQPPKGKSKSASADLVKQIQKKQAQQAQQTAKTQQPAKTVAPEAPKHVTPTPTPPAPRPAPTVSAPKVTTTPTSPMQIPVPKTTAPKLAGSYGGPVTAARAGQGTTAGSGSGSAGSSRPAPSFAPSSGGASSGSGRFSGSGAYGSGQAGNPGPGNPNGRPGIDAIKEPDFGPYMRELQRRIKMNWDPPKGNESKRVVLLFKIAKDGRLLSVKVSRSSGVPAADRAAIQAVELTAPFKPLPAEFRGQNVDIQFTFDYNVFGASRY